MNIVIAKSQHIREEYARDVRTYFELLAQRKECSLSNLDKGTLRHFGAMLIVEKGQTALQVKLPNAVTTVLFRNRAKEVKERIWILQREMERGEFAANGPLADENTVNPQVNKNTSIRTKN